MIKYGNGRSPSSDERPYCDLIMTRGGTHGYASQRRAVQAEVWVPAGTEPDPEGEAEVLAAWLELAAENAGRLETALGMMAEVHPHSDHAYLFVIGSLPQRQGTGLGSALIRHVTQRLDRDGVAAYLEATCEDNRRLYARHGFADVRVIQLPTPRRCSGCGATRADLRTPRMRVTYCQEART